MTAGALPNHFHVRPFEPDDTAACLAVFDSNRPDYFVKSERDLFASFLERGDCPFFVVEDSDRRVIACGGYHVDDQKRTGRMCWGMVSRSHHRRGVGELLLADRLMSMYEDAGPLTVGLDTSHKTVGFFKRVGFVSIEFVPDGYGGGLHKHEMSLELDDTAINRLRARIAGRPAP